MQTNKQTKTNRKKGEEEKFISNAFMSINYESVERRKYLSIGQGCPIWRSAWFYPTLLKICLRYKNSVGEFLDMNLRFLFIRVFSIPKFRKVSIVQPLPRKGRNGQNVYPCYWTEKINHNKQKLYACVIRSNYLQCNF